MFGNTQRADLVGSPRTLVLCDYCIGRHRNGTYLNWEVEQDAALSHVWPAGVAWSRSTHHSLLGIPGCCKR